METDTTVGVGEPLPESVSEQAPSLPSLPPPPPPVTTTSQAGSDNLLQLQSQSLSLNVDLVAGRVSAFAELNFQTSIGLDGTCAESVSLCCSPQCVIQSVTVNSEAANFWRNRTQVNDVDETDPKTIRGQLLTPEWQPRLIVSFPAAVLYELRNNQEALAEGGSVQLLVEISYTLAEPTAGAHFVKISPSDREYSQFFTQNKNAPAWLWIPSIHQTWARCPWTITLTVQQDCLVACSGELQSTSVLPNRPDKTITYKIDYACDADAIGVMVGRQLSSRSLDTEERFYSLVASQKASLVDDACASQFAKCFNYIQTYLGVVPRFQSCDIAWVSHAPLPIVCAAPSLIILSDDLLHSPDELDEALQLKRLIPMALSSQWFDAFLSPKTEPDAWLVPALATYTVRQYLKELLGQNDVRLQIKLDMDRVCELDFDQPPLSQQLSANLPADKILSEKRLELVALKGPLVLHTIERTIGEQNLQAAIRSIVKAARDNTANTLVSVNNFLKLLKKNSGKEIELKAIADQLIYHPGCPIFTITYHYNRKKNVVELRLQQTSTAAPLDPAVKSTIQPCMGTLTIRIHETESSFDHVISVDDVVHTYEFAYRSKAKRNRKPYPRHPDETIDDLRYFADWRELDPDYQTDQPVMWLRVDPEFAWLASIQVVQTDRSWRHQLFADHDVVSQYQAIHALREYPSKSTALALLRCLADKRQFYMIRAEAAVALASCAKEELDYVGARYLLNFFTTRHSLGTAPLNETNPDDLVLSGPRMWSQGMPIPKPNNFTDVTEYFVQKAIPAAMLAIPSGHGVPHVHAIRFLLALLRYNDNDENPFSDAQYVAVIIRSLGECFRQSSASAAKYLEQEAPNLVPAILQEIERVYHRDLLFPSPRKIATAVCLYAKSMIQNADLAELTLSTFMEHTILTAQPAERQAAFHALAKLGLGEVNILKYLLLVVQRDSTPIGHVLAANALLMTTAIAATDASCRFHYDLISQRIREDSDVRDMLFEAIRNTRDPFLKSHLASFIETVIRVQTNRLEAPRVRIKATKPDPKRKRPAQESNVMETPIPSGAIDFQDTMEINEPIIEQQQTKKPKQDKPVSLTSLIRQSIPTPKLQSPSISLMTPSISSPLPSSSLKVSFTLSAPSMENGADKKNSAETPLKQKKSKHSSSAATPPPPPPPPVKLTIKIPTEDTALSPPSQTSHKHKHKDKKDKKKKKKKHHNNGSTSLPQPSSNDKDASDNDSVDEEEN